MTKIPYRNELIKKRRKKKAIRKMMIFLMFLISILIILCLKLSYFNINQIIVLNNKNITKEEIIKLSNIKLGTNIFCQNFKKSEIGVSGNPYILDVSFSRKIPDKIEILVTERKAEFYTMLGDKYAIFDKEAMVLELTDKLSNNKLIKVDGISQKNLEVGHLLGDKEDKNVKTIKLLSDLNQRKKDGVPEMSSIDFADSKNLIINYGNMNVILGTWYNIEDKLNRALNILQADNIKSAKGYIDVSFNGIPVVSTQR